MPVTSRHASDPAPRRRGVARWSGPLPGWPRPVDHLVESWWRLPARLRLVAVLVLAAVLVVGVTVRGRRSPWGPAVPVVVAATDTRPGSPVVGQVRDRPAGLVPADALATPPTHAVAARHLREGEVVTTADVARDLAELLGPDELGVALAQDLPDLPTHARVALLGTALDGTGRRLAGGRLLARTDGWTWIAVPRSAGPAVAAAVATGQVTVALAPP